MTAPATFQDKRLWLAGGALAAVVIVAAGWFLFISPKLSSASSMRSQTSSTEDQNNTLQSKTTELQKESQNLGTLRGQLQTALAALPTDSGMPQFTDEVTTLAAANHVKINSIAVGGLASAGGAATGSGVVSSVYSFPVTIMSSGPVKQQLAFVTAVEHGARRALVTSSQVNVASGAGSVDTGVDLTTQLTLFSQPQTPTQIAQLKKLLAANPTT
jgi:Tfp pilus assembly protein PilO